MRACREGVRGSRHVALHNFGARRSNDGDEGEEHKRWKARASREKHGGNTNG
jgi:hypothetical protein